MVAEQDFERFYVKAFGVDPKKFESLWSSPEIDAKIQQSDVLADRYGLGIFGVPTIVVNGKYRLQVESAGGPDALIELVNWLVAKESK